MGKCHSTELVRNPNFDSNADETASQEVEEGFQMLPLNVPIDHQQMRPKFISSLTSTYSLARAEKGAVGTFTLGSSKTSLANKINSIGDHKSQNSAEIVTSKVRVSPLASAAKVVTPGQALRKNHKEPVKHSKTQTLKSSTSQNKEGTKEEIGRKKICLQVRGHGSLLHSTTVCKLTLFDNSGPERRNSILISH